MEPDTPQIDNVEILDLLGKGGMSLVYKARQKQLDRIVAVKVLSKLAVRGEDGIRRFQKEAKLTSMLDHPNIVKTISFGLSKDEQPYLVMEYLEGLSLADDLKQNGRLKLQKFKDVFLPVLSALNQAHQAGMVHRDIKPGNIMICRNETGGETVKLVDFGIAKVFGDTPPGNREAHNLTKSGAVLGSPTYMSPEQCQGKPLDGRSDLYSMACVMYETLSGEPPFSGESLLEVMQKHSVEPPPTVSELSRKIDIRKELAKVTLWGLAKDPAARPQTASEFARKLNEVLERITLDKVPRLKKSAAVSARTLAQQPLTIALVLLCALMICAALFVLKHHQSRVQVQGKTAAKTADAFKAASLGKDERKYERSLARAEKMFGADSLRMLPSLDEQANWYGSKNKYAEAEPLLNRALAIREKLLGPNHPDVATSLESFAICYSQQGKNAKAEPLFKRALSIREKALKPNDPMVLVVRSLSGMVNCYSMEGKHAEAEPLYKRILAIKEEAVGPNDPRLEVCLKDLADCYQYQRKYKEAELLLKRSLAIGEKTLNSDAPELAGLLENLAMCYVHQGRGAKAEPLLKRALDIREKLGPNDTNVANTASATATLKR